MARSAYIYLFIDRLGPWTIRAGFTVKHEALEYGKKHFDPKYINLYRIHDGTNVDLVEVNEWVEWRHEQTVDNSRANSTSERTPISPAVPPTLGQ